MGKVTWRKGPSLTGLGRRVGKGSIWDMGLYLAPQLAWVSSLPLTTFEVCLGEHYSPFPYYLHNHLLLLKCLTLFAQTEWCPQAPLCAWLVHCLCKKNLTQESYMMEKNLKFQLHLLLCKTLCSGLQNNKPMSVLSCPLSDHVNKSFHYSLCNKCLHNTTGGKWLFRLCNEQNHRNATQSAAH